MEHNTPWKFRYFAFLFVPLPVGFANFSATPHDALRPTAQRLRKSCVAFHTRVNHVNHSDPFESDSSDIVYPFFPSWVCGDQQERPTWRFSFDSVFWVIVKISVQIILVMLEGVTVVPMEADDSKHLWTPIKNFLLYQGLEYNLTLRE